jgi:hypothetical protein
MSFGLVVLAVDSGQPMLRHGLSSSAAGVCITPTASWTNASSGSMRLRARYPDFLPYAHDSSSGKLRALSEQDEKIGGPVEFNGGR